MKKIKLANSEREALCDDEDYPMLSRHRWHLDKPSGYAATVVDGALIYMQDMVIFGEPNEEN